MAPIPSGPLAPEEIDAIVADLRKRFHNMPEKMKKEALREALEARLGKAFDEATAKSHAYVAGENLLRPRDTPGHFNTMSLGNWMTLCRRAGVQAVPARLAGVLNPLAAFSLSTGSGDRLGEEDRRALAGISAALAQADPSDVLRWDAGMGEQIKVFGQASLAPVGEARGWTEIDAAAGEARGRVRLPVFTGERLANMFLAWPDPNPHNGMPCWIRTWTDARRIDAVAPDGEAILTPVEWRVYVRDGSPVAVSSFYPSLADGLSDLDRAEISMALDAARAVIGLMEDLRITPHHPRYERRRDLDPDAVHFSLDFLSLAHSSESAPAIAMLEGGPAHLRHPHFGAHPCCFGTGQDGIEPRGVAHGRFIDTEIDLAALTFLPFRNESRPEDRSQHDGSQEDGPQDDSSQDGGSIVGNESETPEM